jgi:hypothetical protein
MREAFAFVRGAQTAVWRTEFLIAFGFLALFSLPLSMPGRDAPGRALKAGGLVTFRPALRGQFSTGDDTMPVVNVRAIVLSSS